jgi:hypothetical protein
MVVDPMSQPSDPPPTDGKFLGWLTAVKTLSVTNVLVIAMLAVIAVPVYFVYRTLNDEDLLDRFFSHYKELSSQAIGCTLREVKYHGSEWWAVSTGFAFQGADRYVISVVLDYNPDSEQITSYCQTVKIIADSMHKDEELQ